MHSRQTILMENKINRACKHKTQRALCTGKNDSLSAMMWQQKAFWHLNDDLRKMKLNKYVAAENTYFLWKRFHWRMKKFYRLVKWGLKWMNYLQHWSEIVFLQGASCTVRLGEVAIVCSVSDKEVLSRRLLGEICSSEFYFLLQKTNQDSHHRVYTKEKSFSCKKFSKMCNREFFFF